MKSHLFRCAKAVCKRPPNNSFYTTLPVACSIRPWSVAVGRVRTRARETHEVVLFPQFLQLCNWAQLSNFVISFQLSGSPLLASSSSPLSCTTMSILSVWIPALLTGSTLFESRLAPVNKTDNLSWLFSVS
jgi:hypothetical protein